MKNRTLYFGDNLDILRDKIPDESIDLIYLDPPFNSNRDYNILFKEGEHESKSQIKAFEDTWHWTRESQDAFDELVRFSSQRVSNLMLALEKFIGHNDVLAYLTMMTIRLIELHRVLKPTGSLYLHCDPTASHYLKIVLDIIFGVKNFQNEIIWRYRRWPTKAYRYQRMHDVILFYSKTPTNERTFNILHEELAESTKKQWGTKKQKAVFEDGKRVISSTTEEESPGPPLSDVWEISIIAPRSKERLGYPTQKPEELLENIIRASSNKEDWVLDPFCGCGTTVAVAERLGRNWIGIDITVLSINLIKSRIKKGFPGTKGKITVDGIPTDVRSARAFFKKDPYQFEMWAVGLVNGVWKETKGPDKGIDGSLILQDTDKEGKFYRMGIVQVKGGHVQRNQVATLKADVEREKADFGVFITLEKPTRLMQEEAVAAGEFKISYNNSKYPKIQIITIGELLNGIRLDLPSGLLKTPIRQAEKKKISNNLELFI